MAVEIPPLLDPMPKASDPENFEYLIDRLLAAIPSRILAMNAQHAENNAIAAALPAMAIAAAAAAPEVVLATKMDKDNPVGAAALLGGACVGITFATMETVAAWHIATLPSSNDGTYDGLLIEGFLGPWIASKPVFKVSAKNRGGFVSHYHEGSSTGDSGLEFYGQTDGSVNVYMALRNATYSGALRMEGINCTLYPVPAQVSAPTGTLLWSQVGSTAAGSGASYTHPDTHPPGIIQQDENNRFVTDTEKISWSAKQDALVSGASIKTVNGLSLMGAGDIAISGGSGGTTATVSIGTVTAGAAGSSPAVTNSGTPSAAILDFSIPAGATGAEGPAGPGVNRAVIALGAASGATSINVSAGECHTFNVAASATATLSFTGWGASGTVSDQMLVISMGASSTINWPAGYKFIGADGTIYTTFAAAQTPLSTSQVNHVVLWTIDGGATVYVRAG